MGLPGSGKSHYFQRLGIHPLSSDALRLILSDDENNQVINGPVFAALHYLLIKRVELGNAFTYIDATSLTRRERRPYIEIARAYKCDIEALYFDVPLAICLKRNSQRGRQVPVNVLELMAARLNPPSVSEGFDQVSVVPHRDRPGADPEALQMQDSAPSLG